MIKIYFSLFVKQSTYHLKPALNTGWPYALLLIGTLLPFISFAQAPTISYPGPQTYTAGTTITPLSPTSSGVAAAGYRGVSVNIGSGFSSPQGVAVDAKGNVYVADTQNNLVKEIPAGGGAPVTLGSGFNQPTGVAVDAAGNIYVADYGNDAIKEIPVGNGAVITLALDATANSNLNAPVGIAIDAAGNIYGTDNYWAFKIPAGSGTASIIGAFAVGYGYPSEGIAVDALENVYVANSYGVAEIPAAGGQQFIVPGITSTVTGVAVDALGNLYVAEAGNPANGVLEYPVGGGAAISIGSGFSAPFGIAVDGAGNVYVADQGNSNVSEIGPAGGYYINAPLPPGLNFDSATGIISGTPATSAPTTTYTVTACNSSGHTPATLSITVALPPLPAVSYNSPQTYIQGTAIAALKPTSTSVGTPGYSSTPVTLATSWSDNGGVAVDLAGNVYSATPGATSVQEIPVAGGSPLNIGSSLNLTGGIAVDASGNLYVGTGNTVEQIRISDGTTVVLGSGFTSPRGVAVDAAANVYVADNVGTGGGAFYKIAAGGGGQVVLGSGGGANPVGIAVDGLGNVYGVVEGGNTVQEFPASGGNPVNISGSFTFSTDVAVDAGGNIYVSDEYNIINKITPGGVSVTLGAGFLSPQGLTVDANGDVYVADSGNGAVKEIKLNGGYYINPALPSGLNFNNTSGVISGTPLVSSPATIYTVAAYNPTGTKSATVSIKVNALPLPTISYASPQTYTINTAITALKPTGAGVAAAAYSSTPGYVGSGFSNPTDVAVDAQGNLYIADQYNNAVKKIPSGGGTPVIIGSGFNEPVAVAVDAAGNVYVADEYNSAIKEIPAGGATAPITLGSGFDYPTGVAVDATGNVYVADSGNGLVKKIPVGGGAPVAIGSGFDYPNRVAVDAAGNVYVSDGGTLLIAKIPVGGGTPVTIVSGAGNPQGIAIDAEGNLFYADAVNNTVEEIPAGGGTQVPIGSGFSSPSGVAVDGAGNLYVADAVNNLVKKFSPGGGYYINTPLPAGLQLNMTTGIITGTPTAISPAKNYTVTAYNLAGGVAAALNITVTASSNANLASLVISSGSLTPVFAAGTTSYTASVNNSITSITITPTTSYPAAAVKVNGTTVASGSASASLPLNVGTNTITTVVTAQDGVTTLTYTVIVTRSVNANLAGLAISTGTLSPVFTSETTGYTVQVSNSTTSVTITPTTSDPAATVKVNGATVPSGSASASQPLNVGPNTITTIVTASDGITTLDYTIIVTRASSSNASLANLSITAGTLSPVFAAGTTGYTAQVSNSTTSITVTPATSDPTAAVKINGTPVSSGSASASLPLSVGANTITAVVTAQDGVTTQTYTIIITRAASSNASLNALAISSGTLTPVFAATTTGYTASVVNAVSSITVTPALSDANATLTVNGIATASGSASAPLLLNVGSNIITVVVTAQDGVTTQTYTITVNRAASSNANLDALLISSGTLTPVFAATTTSYTASVVNAVSSITVTSTPNDADATLTVNGMVTASGSASAPLPLNVGSNTITVVVTAQDGVTTQAYAINVTRPASANASLANLSISTGSLSPAFAPGTLSYSVSVPATDSTISITPVVSDATAAVTVNGVAVQSGAASAAIALSPGSNTLTVVVTAQNGATQTYTINVARAEPTIFTLPDTNFKLTITGATCNGSDNGSVAINAVQSLNYTATLSGNGLNTPYSFTDSLTIGSLAAGSYNVCLTVAGQPQYQQCYNVVISQPQALSVYAAVNSTTNSLDLNLSGGSTYNIRLNGSNYTTTNNTYSLPLQAGENNLEVTTDRLCQGTFTRSFNILSTIVPFPDPFQSTLSVNLGAGTLNNATVQVYNLSYNKLFYSKQYGTLSGIVQFDLSSLTKGVYALKITSGNTENIFKIIKE